MNITDLEEADGLTAEMVHGYLTSSPWVFDASTGRWRFPGQPGHYISGGIDEVAVLFIADIEGRSVQAILREMNPRMRKGLPSYEEQRAHGTTGGIWIATHGELGHGGSICFVSFHGDDGIEHDLPFVIWDGEEWREPDWLAAEVENWSFWPCDAHGNKVRWPKVSP